MAELNPLEVDVRFHAYLGGDRTKPENKRNYTATVVFANVEDAVECGAKFVVWTLQRKARDGEFPTDRKVRVTSSGDYEKTPEELLRTLTEAQQLAVYEAMKARIEAEVKAKVEAQMKAYKPAENEDLTEEELEQLTSPDPEPATKPASKKANRR